MTDRKPLTVRLASVTVAACCVTIASGVARVRWTDMAPGHDYSAVLAPWWVVVISAVLAGLSVGAMAARIFPRPAVLSAAWMAIALLVWSSSGLVFDLLRTAAVLGIPGLPPFVDWLGMASRATALVTALTLLRATVGFQTSTSAGHHSLIAYGPWFGHAAALLSIPYPALKIYWSFGGTVGWSGGATRNPAIGEAAMLVLLVALSLALVQPWGRSLPRRLLLIAGYGAAVPLILTGAVAGFGTISQILGITNGPIAFKWSEWIVYYTYVDWLLLGIALAGAARVYQLTTRATSQTGLHDPSSSASPQSERVFE